MIVALAPTCHSVGLFEHGMVVFLVPEVDSGSRTHIARFTTCHIVDVPLLALQIEPCHILALGRDRHTGEHALGHQFSISRGQIDNRHFRFVIHIPLCLYHGLGHIGRQHIIGIATVDGAHTVEFRSAERNQLPAVLVEHGQIGALQIVLQVRAHHGRQFGRIPVPNVKAGGLEGHERGVFRRGIFGYTSKDTLTVMTEIR